MHKIGRDAFLYLEGRGDDFAQCSSCWLFAVRGGNTAVPGRCAVLGPKIEISPDDTCGYYGRGEYDDGIPISPLFTPEEVGLVRKTQVRCENCRYGGEHCKLYVMLNKKFPAVFGLDTKIKPRACCNAWSE